MALSLHSGINTTYFPWSSGPNWAESDRYYAIYTDLVNVLPDYFFQDYINEEITFTKKLSSTTAGEWGDWMYSARKCEVPVTFEMYHEEGSDDYLPTPVVDNDTHEIWQFDTIESYFAPKEEKIEALWNDVSPAFNYWLATTPQLEISGVVITGENSVGSTLTIEAKVKNTSPRVTTVEAVKVVFDDFNPLTSEGSPITISTINENYKASVQFDFELDTQIEQDSNVTLLVGNDFVGYYPLVIESDFINKSQDTPVDILGILTGILVIISTRRKIQKK
jgi:hypothetical protein